MLAWAIRRDQFGWDNACLFSNLHQYRHTLSRYAGRLLDIFVYNKPDYGLLGELPEFFKQQLGLPLDFVERQDPVEQREYR